jgi:deferrochelatase/peroxidase EfeB
MPTINYDDVQGAILRGYRVDLARHFILTIHNPAVAGKLLADLVDGVDGLPKVTSAQRITPKPEYFFNICFTCSGLAKMGLSAAQLASFDPAFQLGADNAVTANAVGDIGESAPANWVGGLGKGEQVHVLFSLWISKSPQVLAELSARLRAAFADSMTELYAQDAVALPDNKIHFGFRDSIAQPTVIGAPPGKHPSADDQAPVATGEFLLGYANQSGGVYAVLPVELATNSSYAAFRILEQDVAGFNALLARHAEQAGMDTEKLAAKICGRWRNGNPLELAPDAQGEVLPVARLNKFSYVNSDPALDDTLGLKCPIGSHIRRNNPRDAAVVGTDSSHHRIVRRAMPYGGPEYDPARPDNIPRGLAGYFINASLRNQFEFLTSQWSGRADFVKAATDSNGNADGNAVFNISGQDGFLGVNAPAGSSFTLAALGKGGVNNTVLQGFGRTITTRGGVYGFFPSISGLRYLAGLSK